MFNVITSSFFQKKTCVLPGIGTLTLVIHTAESDFPNKQIKAPAEEIVFSPGQPGEKLFNEFSAISELMKKKLEQEGLVEITGIGMFTKTIDGNIAFTPVIPDENLQQPVTAVRVIRERSEHAMLVGDKETTNKMMTEFLNEETPAAKKWKLWAIILGVAALLLLAIYLYLNGFSFSNPAR
jgi:hypothetical protein